MVEKLRSILRQTSWSLVLKAVVFGVAWWALPFWLFLLLALWLYFIPITGAGKVSVPFFVLLLILYLQAHGAIAAILFGALFFFILLIKDFLIIDRRSAYEVLMLVLSYLLIRGFFLHVGSSLSYEAFFDSVIAAWAVAAMVAGFIKNFSVMPEDSANETRSFHRMLGWMVFMMMWQLLVVGLLLPLNFLYQSATVFLLGIVLMDLIPQYVFGELSRMKVLITGSMIFALLTIVFASARWTL